MLFVGEPRGSPESLHDNPGASRIDKRHEPSALQAKLTQLAFTVGDSPQLLPLLTSSQQLVVEAVRRGDGSVVVLRPRPEAVK